MRVVPVVARGGRDVWRCLLTLVGHAGATVGGRGSCGTRLRAGDGDKLGRFPRDPAVGMGDGSELAPIDGPAEAHCALHEPPNRSSLCSRLRERVPGLPMHDRTGAGRVRCPVVEAGSGKVEEGVLDLGLLAGEMDFQNGHSGTRPDSARSR